MFSHLLALIFLYGLYGTASALRLNSQDNKLQECGMEDYASGAWVPITKTSKSFVCCSWDVEAGSAEEKSCAKGMPVLGLTASYSGDAEPFKYIMSGGHSCSCDAQPSTHDRVLDFEKYEWRPSVCQIKAFDANQFCSMLKKRRIVLVGDSMAEQAGSTLMNMIRAGSADGYGCSKDVQVRVTDTFGKWRDRVHDADIKWFMEDQRNEWDVPDLDAHLQVKKVAFQFTDAIQSSTKEDILILSSGAHWHDEAMYQNFLNSIATSIQKKRNQSDAPVVLWKTISGAGCSPQGEITGDYFLDSQKSKEYSWNLFPHYDAMAAAVMQSMSPPVPILNVSMLYQRGDAHPGNFGIGIGKGDCLHFCSPGPLDVIAPILEHVLRKVL